MNREIKFRAWDDLNKKWLCGYEYPNLGGFSIMGEVMAFGEWSQVLSSFSLSDWDKIIVMQFTGLKDKNRKEIYEGDIVKRTTFNYDYDDVDNPTAKKYVEQVSFIEYRNNGFWVNMENFGWEGENLWDWDLMEVIGNKYEHPELLNKEQH